MIPAMESDITALKGLSKRIDALVVFEEFYVDQLESISESLIEQINDKDNIILLDIIAKDVYKLLFSARQDRDGVSDIRVRLVCIMKSCILKLHTLSESIASNVVFLHVKNCSEKDLKVKSLLLREVFATLLSFGCTDIDAVVAEEALLCLNHTLVGVSRSERLALSARFNAELADLVIFLLHCGDYTMQEVIMETFTRLTPQTHRKSGCQAWFDTFPPEAQAAFLGFGQIVFQIELRPFLNAVNGKWKTGVHTLACSKLMLGNYEMHNPESEYLPKFFVDFSKKSQVITFFGVQEKGAFDNGGNPLIFVKISKQDIKKSVLIATKKPNYHQLTLVLRRPLDILTITKYRQETVVIMILKELGAYDIDIMKNVMGNTFEADVSKLSCLVDDKQHLVDERIGNKRFEREPGFFMFPPDFANANLDITMPENNSPVGTNANRDGRIATPMNFAPVRVDCSTGKSTFADFMTEVDSDQEVIEQKTSRRKATPGTMTNVMPSKATPAPTGGKLLSRNLTPAAMKSKDSKLHPHNPVSDLKRRRAPSPNLDEIVDESKNSKQEQINTTKKWIATPVVTKGKARIPEDQKQCDEFQGEQPEEPSKKTATIKEMDQNSKPPAKKPRGKPRKTKSPVKPKAQRPKRSAKPKQESRVSTRKNRPRKSGIESSEDASGDDFENETSTRTLRRRNCSRSKEEKETQLTIATDEIFKPKSSAKTHKKSQLPQNSFVLNKNSQQLATYKGQKEAVYNRNKDSSKDSTFDHLLQSIPRTKMDRKLASPESSRKEVKEPMLFDEFDYDLQDDGDSSWMAMHPKGSTAQNKPQIGNKLHLKVEKSVPAKNAIKKRSMRSESDKKPAQKLLKLSNSSNVKKKEHLIGKTVNKDIWTTPTMSVTSELFRRCSVDDEFDNLKEEFLNVKAKKDKSSKLKLSTSRKGCEKGKNPPEQEIYNHSDDDACMILGTFEKPKKAIPNHDSPSYFFEDLFCNSGEENSDAVAQQSPSPKEKLQPKNTLSEMSDRDKLTKDLQSGAKAKMLAEIQEDAKVKKILKAQQDETDAKLAAKTKLEETKAKLLIARALKQDAEAKAELARVQKETAKLINAQQEEAAKAKLLRAQKEAKEKALKEKAMLSKAQEERAKTERALQQEKAKLKLLEEKNQGKRLATAETTDVVGKKNKPKINYSSNEDAIDEDCSDNRRSGQTALSMHHKLLQQLKKKSHDQIEEESVDLISAEKSASSLKLKSSNKYDASMKKMEQERKKPVETRMRIKQPQPESSEDDLQEDKVPELRKKASSFESHDSNARNASSSNNAIAKKDQNEKLLLKLEELHKRFNHREIKAKNSLRLEVLLQMKKELKIALEKEKQNLDQLNGRLQLVKEIINVLQKEFDLSGLKDNCGNLPELAEKLLEITNSYWDPKDLEILAKEALNDMQKTFYNDVHASISSVLAIFKLI